MKNRATLGQKAAAPGPKGAAGGIPGPAPAAVTLRHNDPDAAFCLGFVHANAMFRRDGPRRIGPGPADIRRSPVGDGGAA